MDKYEFEPIKSELRHIMEIINGDVASLEQFTEQAKKVIASSIGAPILIPTTVPERDTRFAETQITQLRFQMTSDGNYALMWSERTDN